MLFELFTEESVNVSFLTSSSTAATSKVPPLSSIAEIAALAAFLAEFAFS